MKAHHNSKTPLVLENRFTAAAVPFMLNAYKHGLFELGELFASDNFLGKLEKGNYAMVHKDNHSGTEIAVMQLTQKGASFIENNFLELLTELSPYYIFPIIRQGDKVELLADAKNEFNENGNLVKKIISSPSGSSCLDKGLYTVQTCDASSISVTDDCYVLYRLRLSEFRDKIRLYVKDLRPESEERKARFGVIRVRSLVERLQEKLHTIRLAELIDELYSMPHTKDRLSNG